MILLIVLLGLLFLIPFVSRKLLKKEHNGKPLSEMSGPLSVPLLGTAYVFLNGGPSGFWNKYHKQCEKTYPGPMKSVLGGYTNINIFKDVHFEEVLSNIKHITKSSAYRFGEVFLGNGLITSSGEGWHSRRKLFTPAFHFKILEAQTEVVFEKANILVSLLQDIPNREEMDIWSYIQNCALDIICATAMGIQLNAQEGYNNDYVTSLQTLLEQINDRIICPWLQPDFIWKFSSNYRKTQECLKLLGPFAHNVIKKRRQVYDVNPENLEDFQAGDTGRKRCLPFLDLLLQTTDDNENPLSNELIREEVDTFMFAGYDTTATTMYFTLITLGNYPEIQEKLHEEFDSILQGSDRPFNKSDLRQMKYLEMVIKEILRLYPAAPVIQRIITEDSVLCNYFCPKNTQIILDIFQLHRDPANFPDPEKFDPERFTPERCAKRHPYAYVPFSAGPRNCIGQKFAMMESKAVLSTFLRSFTVVSHMKHEDFRPTGAPLIKLEKICKVTLIPRK